ncbi:MAG TPA: hypothetical protein VFG52_12710 [Xanthomonadales bacterium]|nr:hypothetical protein [Xanthomonadales bacterium]
MSQPGSPALDQAAYDCLAYLLHHRVDTRNQPEQKGWNLTTLLKLESLGLIEQVHDINAPLEVARIHYRLTQRGTEALRQNRPHK